MIIHAFCVFTMHYESMKPDFSLLLICILWLALGCSKDSDPTEESEGEKPVPVTEIASAFAGAEGFGKDATGGRGGKVLFVTNLNDAGTGSLRAAIETSGKRYILFKISGTIQLKSRLLISNGDVTIAGQTAPGDGICLRDYSVVVNADNVIIRYMRFRMGDAAQQEGDALEGRFHKNIIIDHCSMSWSTDETTSFYGNENTTIQWCIIAESLRNSVHNKGAHGYGGIWGGKNASFHHNLLAHHDSRNARLGEEAGKAFALTDKVDLRNNVVYNWGSNSIYGGEGMNVNIVNCYFKPGPATMANNGSSKQGRIYSPDKNKIKGTEVYDVWGKFYIAGNYVEGNTNATNDNWTYGVFNQFHNTYTTYPASCTDVNGNTIPCEYTIPVTEEAKTAMKLSEQHVINNNVTTHTALIAYDKVLQISGASLGRDAVDDRIINNVRDKTYSFEGSNGSTNGIIDTQADVGGWPILNSTSPPLDTDNDGMPDEWEQTMKLAPTVANANGRNLSTAFDNIEVYLNSLVKTITDTQLANE